MWALRFVFSREMISINVLILSEIINRCKRIVTVQKCIKQAHIFIANRLYLNQCLFIIFFYLLISSRCQWSNEFKNELYRFYKCSQMWLLHANYYLNRNEMTVGYPMKILGHEIALLTTKHHAQVVHIAMHVLVLEHIFIPYIYVKFNKCTSTQHNE